MVILQPSQLYFNPRSPCGERRFTASEMVRIKEFQSTLPVRGATTIDTEVLSFVIISIHAPRAGSDALEGLCFRRTCYFNPRSPCGERRLSSRN